MGRRGDTLATLMLAGSRIPLALSAPQSHHPTAATPVYWKGLSMSQLDVPSCGGEGRKCPRAVLSLTLEDGVLTAARTRVASAQPTGAPETLQPGLIGWKLGCCLLDAAKESPGPPARLAALAGEAFLAFKSCGGCA